MSITITVRYGSRVKYKDGKREDLWFGYYGNGQLWFKRNYKDGKREGISLTYYGDGSAQLEQTGTFRNGVKISH